ncbi:MAG: hypothetical protein MUE50_27820, partial [Pirellulaceae bacterium]|nr:hypothetical protein [Pirellulaceae bacterium]
GFDVGFDATCHQNSPVDRLSFIGPGGWTLQAEARRLDWTPDGLDRHIMPRRGRVEERGRDADASQGNRG